MQKKIILFTKTPSLGLGKSRLSPLLNEEERLDLVKRLLGNISKEIEKTGLAYSVHYEGVKEDIAYLSLDLVAQKGDELGQRMLGSLAYELEDEDAVVLVGSDLVNLDAGYIEEAFQALEEVDLVFGPTEDGGYGLVGMKRPWDVFSGITYSRPDVLENTLARAKDLGLSYYLLESIRDIDEPIDLVREEVGADKIEVLGHGEYNLNYRYDEDYVFRINIGSQLNLADDQILYEYGALKQLEDSGVTPQPYQVQKKGKWIPRGYLIMEYLPGRTLDYEGDMDTAAYLLSTIHNHPFNEEGFIKASQPFQTMYDEFISMFSVYEAWEDRDERVVSWIKRLLAIARSRGLSQEMSRPCIINTELNNRNFIIGPSKEESYVIDWEKPIIGDCEQDLAHFTVPTTTNWKTDKIMNREEIDSFLDEYEKYREVDRDLYDKYYMFNCLRGLTWCSMAKVEYSQERTLSNPETLEKINLFLSEEFIEFIYKEFYEVYDV